jgi:hypothetical protein
LSEVLTPSDNPMTNLPFFIQLECIQKPYENFTLQYDFAGYKTKEFGELYHLCGDRNLLNGDYQYSKGILLFLFLLENWQKRLASASSEQGVFLPFDFSDEYLGGFVVWAQDAHTLRVSYQVARDLYGWGDSATQIEQMGPKELVAIVPPHEVPRALFEEAIAASRYQILAALQHLPLRSS